MKKNYYEILGVSKNASKKEIRVKYIELVKKYHPDINSSEDSTEIVQDINAAYDVLSNDKKRQEYDASLNQTNTSNIEAEKEEVKEEPFNYEEEINKYTDREKKYAKKISVEKIIKDELLKAESIIKAKLEVIELARQENMIEDFYFDKVEEFWEVSNNYVGSLEKLIETATDYNLDHLVVEINEKINLVNNNLDNMPLTIIDAVNYLENKENKERVESKIVNDINLVKNQLSSKTVLYDQIIDGYINEKNYDRYRESRLYELNNIINNISNIKKLAELYNLDKEYQSISNIDEYIKIAKKRIKRLPKTFKQAKKQAGRYRYYNEMDNLSSEVNELMNRLRQMKSRMSSGLGNIIKLKELQEVSAKYIILVNKYKKLNSTKEKLQIEKNIPLECIINIKNLGHAYQELVNDREEHLNEFFDVFTDSTKRRTVGGLLLHDNVVLTSICIANITAATMSVISKNFTNPSIPSSIVLTSVNTISLKNKYKLYKANYTKGKNIINSDNDTKEEYKEYCLRRNIKNKSI